MSHSLNLEIILPLAVGGNMPEQVEPKSEKTLKLGPESETDYVVFDLTDHEVSTIKRVKAKIATVAKNTANLVSVDSADLELVEVAPQGGVTPVKAKIVRSDMPVPLATENQSASITYPLPKLDLSTLSKGEAGQARDSRKKRLSQEQQDMQFEIVEIDDSDDDGREQTTASSGASPVRSLLFSRKGLLSVVALLLSIGGYVFLSHFMSEINFHANIKTLASADFSEGLELANADTTVAFQGLYEDAFINDRRRNWYRVSQFGRGKFGEVDESYMIAALNFRVLASIKSKRMIRFNGDTRERFRKLFTETQSVKLQLAIFRALYFIDSQYYETDIELNNKIRKQAVIEFIAATKHFITDNMIFQLVSKSDKWGLDAAEQEQLSKNFVYVKSSWITGFRPHGLAKDPYKINLRKVLELAAKIGQQNVLYPELRRLIVLKVEATNFMEIDEELAQSKVVEDFYECFLWLSRDQSLREQTRRQLRELCWSPEVNGHFLRAFDLDLKLVKAGRSTKSQAILNLIAQFKRKLAQEQVYSEKINAIFLELYLLQSPGSTQAKLIYQSVTAQSLLDCVDLFVPEQFWDNEHWDFRKLETIDRVQLFGSLLQRFKYDIVRLRTDSKSFKYQCLTAFAGFAVKRETDLPKLVNGLLRNFPRLKKITPVDMEQLKLQSVLQRSEDVEESRKSYPKLLEILGQTREFERRFRHFALLDPNRVVAWAFAQVDRKTLDYMNLMLFRDGHAQVVTDLERVIRRALLDDNRKRQSLQSLAKEHGHTRLVQFLKNLGLKENPARIFPKRIEQVSPYIKRDSKSLTLPKFDTYSMPDVLTTIDAVGHVRGRENHRNVLKQHYRYFQSHSRQYIDFVIQELTQARPKRLEYLRDLARLTKFSKDIQTIYLNFLRDRVVTNTNLQ